MEFLKLLQIDRSLVAPAAQESLLVADRVWHEESCPREASALGGVLEKILQRCQASAIWYAPVLLQRKKALERGTWRPPSVAKPALVPTVRQSQQHAHRAASDNRKAKSAGSAEAREYGSTPEGFLVLCALAVLSCCV